MHVHAQLVTDFYSHHMQYHALIKGPQCVSASEEAHTRIQKGPTLTAIIFSW